MIGRLEKTVFDCPDPRTLAAFYATVLGMRINEDNDDWVVIGTEPGARQLAFQRVENWTAPAWGDPHRPQQLHLDIRVDDIETAEHQLLALGATRLPGELEGRYRDLGDGVREWIEIRCGEQRSYCQTVAERDVTLLEHGINPADLIEVHSIEDGCE
jgi:catechol 2,3-dioxygenase-like lactoylglutathione lyase family enzyme